MHLRNFTNRRRHKHQNVKPHTTFRPDIQGMRAIAVLLVAFNHAGVQRLSGGYVGVDVFFVVSGFLITGWLLRTMRDENSVPVFEFYAARARRILPAATLAIAAIAFASYHYLNYVRALSALRDAVWSTCFVANIRFAQQGTDYFARDNPPSPYQHFWTLAVEEQFYIVLPVLLVVLAFLFRSRTPFGRRIDSASVRRIGVVLAIGVAASLYWSIHDTPINPTGAYFSTVDRAWELGIGALLAVSATQVSRLPSWIKCSATWVGLAAIVLAGTTYTSATQFPGYAALLPVLGAALVLAGGIGSAGRWGAGIILSRQPLRLVGDVSYGFYLWHWPFLIIPMEHVGHPLSLTRNLELLAVAFAVSLVTYAVFENPIRHSERLTFDFRSSLLLWPAALLIGLFVSAYYTGVIQRHIGSSVVADSSVLVSSTSASGAPGAQRAPTNAELIRDVTASVAASHLSSHVGTDLTPTPSDLASDRWSNTAGCSVPFGAITTGRICPMGDTSAARTIVLFGDSHAKMWMGPILDFARAQHWRVVPLMKDGCVSAEWTQLSATNQSGLYQQAGPCRKWDTWALGVMRKLKPKAIVLGTNYGIDRYASAVSPLQAAGLSNEVAALARVSPKVIVIQNPPNLSQDPVDCLLHSGATYGSCTYPYTSTLRSFYEQTGSAITGAHGTVLPTTQWFCARDHCPVVVGNIITYIDKTHVSLTYVNQLAGAFKHRLRQVLTS
ncbi:MAG: acyltransferase family protein [Gaiellales bacterium]